MNTTFSFITPHHRTLPLTHASALMCVFALLLPTPRAQAQQSAGVIPLDFSPASILSTNSGLYVTDPNGGTVRRITQAGTEVVATNLPRAYGLAERSDGGICVMNESSRSAAKPTANHRNTRITTVPLRMHDPRINNSPSDFNICRNSTKGMLDCANKPIDPSVKPEYPQRNTSHA